MPSAPEKEPTPVTKLPTPHSVSKLATTGPVIPPTVMRPSVMGLPHEGEKAAEAKAEPKLEPKKTMRQ